MKKSFSLIFIILLLIVAFLYIFLPVGAILSLILILLLIGFLALLPSITLFKRKKYKVFSTVSLLISIITFPYLIFSFDSNTSLIYVLAATIYFSFGYNSLLLLIEPRNNKVKRIRNITILIVTILTLLIIISTIYNIEINPYIYIYSGAGILLLSLIAYFSNIDINQIDSNKKLSNSNKIITNNEIDKLVVLNKMLDDKTITEEEYNKEKNIILKK